MELLLFLAKALMRVSIETKVYVSPQRFDAALTNEKTRLRASGGPKDFQPDVRAGPLIAGPPLCRPSTQTEAKNATASRKKNMFSNPPKATFGFAIL